MFEKIQDGLRKYFRDSYVHVVPLYFHMEMDDAGNHLVRISYKKNGDEIFVDDYEKLKRNSFLADLDLEDSGETVVISEEDRQIIYSLQSLNPEIVDGGILRFDIEPPVLSYLRKHQNVKEEESSRGVNISKDPIEPSAFIDYLPREAMVVTTGYRDEVSDEIIPQSEIKKTKDGKYARINNNFYPLKEPAEQLSKIFDQGVSRIPLRDIPEFVLRDLVLLQNESDAVLTDLAQQITVLREPMKPRVKVDTGQLGWLNFKINYKVGDKEITHNTIQSLENQNYYLVDDTTFIELDRDIIQYTEDYLEDVGAEEIIGGEGFRIPATKFYSIEEFIESIGGEEQLSEAYKDFLFQLEGFDANPDFRMKKTIETRLQRVGLNLRPYQRAGIHWLDWLRRNHLHGVLADDMGLGKTLQALITLRLGYEADDDQRHSLIIAPKSVLRHWQRELKRCFPGQRAYVYHGSNRKKSLLNSSNPIVFITTYATASRDIDYLAEVPFYFLILDEATRIKNPEAVRTQATKALNATHRLALSGTPVENRPAELWSLFDFLMRGHLGKFGTFVRVFEDPIMSGEVNQSKKLGRRISPFLLRRTKKEVAQDLPEKIEIVEWCELTEEQKQLYGQLQDRSLEVFESLKRGEHVNYTKSILPLLTWLKQICDHPGVYTKKFEPYLGRSNKFDWIVGKIDEILEDGDQVVVFSHFLDMLGLLELSMKKLQHSYIRIDGSTNNRQQLIDMFNRREAKVALLSLMAAGHGINMTAANHVIHADRWWNPAVEIQATDRVHRIGQEKTVLVYNILVENTLEERIDRLLELKKEMSDRIVGATKREERKWSREELIELLRPLE